MLLASALALPACKKEATGQVVAVVNGQEISLSELNAELRAENVPQNLSPADQKAARNGALQRLIDRKLLAQQAKDRNLDKDPEFLQQQIRVTDELLITALGKQVTAKLAIPSQTETSKFIADNPSMFANRTVYQMDQVIFAAPADRTQLKGLEADHTLAAVMQRLNGLGIKYEQRKGSFDSAAVPPALLNQVRSLPAGEPFLVSNGPQVVVSVITGQQVMPLDAKQSQALATEALRRQEIGGAAQKQLKEARSTAKIEYNGDFQPPKSTPTPGAPAKS